VLPPWSPDTLDIHHINTGKGDSAVLIFPDGTSLLVDAGATLRPGPRVTPQRPDASRPPGEWIARYIRRVLEPTGPVRLDYALLTHFHEDHMGTPSAAAKKSATGGYQLAGITEVGDHIPIGTMLDRGWPDYNFPTPLTGAMMTNYREFLAWHGKNRRMRVERLVSGRNDQIRLVRQPGRYRDFEVRNIAANGEIWTGVGSTTRAHFPPIDTIPKADLPSENMCSIGLRVSYGRFDYFTGGDMPGLPSEGSPTWHDVETPVAKVVGPVEVHTLNHHGFNDCCNAFFLSTLRPRVHIMSVYAPSHPGMRVLGRLLSTRLYDGPRDIFATNLMDETKVVIGEAADSDEGNRRFRSDADNDRSSAKLGSFMLND
jgi:beta-lactamase superfamily II metal-dependent hydrolase